MTTAETALFQAQSFIDVGQPQRAADVLTRALRDEPERPDLLSVLSRAYVRVGDDDQALRAAHASQTAAGRPVLQAMLVLATVAHRRNDHREVCELARTITTKWPDEPYGHAWYALGLTRLATTDVQRATVRQAMATALDLGQRTPTLLRNAAWIESRFGQREACLAYVDEGLATDPSNADLLKLRAWAVKDATYRATVMLGILAIDPMDNEASTSLEREVEPRLEGLHRLLFVAPFLLALAVLPPPVMPRVVALTLALGCLLLRAASHARFLGSLPQPYVRARWRRQGRTLIASAALVLLGAALFAADLPVVGPVVMAAGLGLWGRAVLGGLTRRVTGETDGSDTQQLLLRAHAVRARNRAVLGTVVGCFALFIGTQYLGRADAGGVAAPFFAIALLVGVAMVSCAALLGWAGRRLVGNGMPATALVLGVAGIGFGAAGAVGVADSTTGPEAGRYQQLPTSERICRRGACYEAPPTPVAPIPTISVPTFDIPTFEPPTFKTPEVPDLRP
jgi:tetratricopeptide (TPR) repeat protein